MALQPQMVDIPFGLGVQERVRPELLESHGAALTLQNVIEVKRGAWSKRPGFTSLAAGILGGGTIALGRRGGSRGRGAGTWLAGSSAGSSDAHNVYDYSLQQSAWVNRGKLSECIVRQYGGVNNAGAWASQTGNSSISNSTFDIMVANGVRVITWSQCDESAANAFLFYQVQDATTGATLTPATQIATYASGTPIWSHKLVSCGNRIWLVYATTAGGDIQCSYIDTTTSTLTLTASFLLSSFTGALSCSPTIGNICAFSGPAYWGVLVKLSGNAIFATMFTDAGAQYGSGITVATASVANFPMAIGGDASTLWTAYLDTTAGPNLVKVNAWGTLPTTTSLGTTSSLAVARNVNWNAVGAFIGQSATASILAFTYAVVGDSNTQTKVVNYIVSAGAILANGQNSWPLSAFVGGPIYRDGIPYMLAVPGLPGAAPGPRLTYNQQTATVHLVDVGFPDSVVLPMRPVATIAPQLYLFQTIISYGSPPNIVNVGNGKYQALIATKKNATAYGLDVIEFDFAATNRWQSSEIGDALHLAGGTVAVYDGSTVQESSFVMPCLGVVSNGAGAIPAGSYGFSFIYEYVDALGNVHWSTPYTTTGVLGAPGSFTVAGYPLNISSRTAGTRVAVYMTAFGGGAYYRVGVLSVGAGAGTATLAITAAPTGTEPQLYTQPGTPGAALPRSAPPGLSCITQHNDGLCGVAPNGHEVWFSSQHVTGEGIWWHPAMIAQVEDPNPVVALASFEGRLYAFTRRNIWIIDGQGFSDNGFGGYSPPQLLPTDCGCIEPRSLVVTSEGCYFQSDRGLMLLNRSSAVSWVGEPLASTLTTYPVVTSAVVDPARHLVLFSLATSESGGTGATGPGRIVVLDYASQQWSTWSVLGGIAVETMWMQGNALYMLMTSGTVLVENVGYQDLGGWVTMQVETAQIKMGGLQGYQRVWRALLLFASVTPCDLTIDFAFDGAAAYTETRTFTASQLATLTVKQVEHVLKNQKCSLLRMRVTDATPTGGPAIGNGQGATLLGARFMYGVNPRKPVANVAR